MRRRAVWGVLLVVVLTSGIMPAGGEFKAPTGKAIAMPSEIPAVPNMDIRTYLKTAAAMDTIHDTIPPDPPFLSDQGGVTVQLGVTYYDMQKNASVCHQIAVDQDGGAHIAWMRSPVPDLSNRHTYYNYVAAGDTVPVSTDGYRTEYVYKSGYCTMDVMNVGSGTPIIAFHQMPSASADYHASVSLDALAASGTEHRGGFDGSHDEPPYVGSPDCPDDVDDMLFIWPRVSVSQFDDDIHLIAKESYSMDHDSMCDPLIATPNYIAYWHGTLNSDTAGFDWSAGQVIVADMGLSEDIATAHNRDEVALSFIKATPDEDPVCSWLDNYNIWFMRSTDDGASWDTTQVTHLGPNHQIDVMDTLYHDYTDTLGVDHTDTFVVFWRPFGDTQILYDNHDNVHIFWSVGMFRGDTCASDIVSYWFGAKIIHWSEAAPSVFDTINVPFSSIFGYPEKFPITYNPQGTCDFPFYRIGNTLKPSAGLAADGKIYVIWTQRYADMHWIGATANSDDVVFAYYNGDISAGTNTANNEIFGCSYNPITGEWSDPIDISNTYTVGCAAGECHSELDASMAKVVDDYIHIFYIDDRDAGLYIQSCGEVVEDPVMYARIPTTVFANVKEHGKFTFGHPTSFKLYGNTPNPFNSITTINLGIKEAGAYSLDIFDLQGHKIKNLIQGNIPRGQHLVDWNGTDSEGNTVPSGLYLYRLKDANGNSVIRRMSLIK